MRRQGERIALTAIVVFGLIALLNGGWGGEDSRQSAPLPAGQRSQGCDPNYTGCVPYTGYDVDCAEVNGPVRVIGTDTNRLDADGDLVGCERGY